MHILRTACRIVISGLLAAALGTAGAGPSALSEAYREQIDRRLRVPAESAEHYGGLAVAALVQAGIPILVPQYVALVDRNPHVQAIFLFWVGGGFPPVLIGASPVSTGRGGEFDHFETPLGVFEHSLANPDFRAEGTLNEHGIRGYGAKGMRVFDLGWQEATRLWGAGGRGTMRLQMHATDPDRLEQRLGSVQSKGCIRIPASLNRLLDHYGVLDDDYLAAAADGMPNWVLPMNQAPVHDAGRYVIVVDSGASERPAWSPPR
ncbi:L,D-transpeptidase [Variovorax humicola]|uniref:L,D-transpeptidase n=1 Tax=Variovorax humicola TaxID=1769758 RepID=A0ABU8WC04_9BURK